MSTRGPFLLGPLLALVFTISQAMRDVHFSGVFQSIDLFEVILMAFPLMTVAFGLYVLARDPGNLVLLARHRRSALAMNLATTSMWVSYFFALKYVEPSVVNTMFGATTLLSAVALIKGGANITRDTPVRAAEYVYYGGLAMVVLLLWAIVLGGASGLATEPLIGAIGLGLVMVSALSHAFSTLFERRLNEHGVRAETVVASRFVLLALVALLVEAADGRPFAHAVDGGILPLMLAVVVLIVVPTWIVQVAVATTSPITLKAIMALAPIFVFALQPLDGRIGYSPQVLMATLLYAAFVIGGNVARGWRTDLAWREPDRQ